MLKVRFLTDGEGYEKDRGGSGSRSRGAANASRLHGFEVEGHAGYGEYGKDIVCAGVSAITQSCLLGLKEVLGDDVRYEKRPGYLRVNVHPCKAKEPGPSAILRTLEMGLISMSKAYPGGFSIEYVAGSPRPGDV